MPFLSWVLTRLDMGQSHRSPLALHIRPYTSVAKKVGPKQTIDGKANVFLIPNDYLLLLLVIVPTAEMTVRQEVRPPWAQTPGKPDC